MSNQHRFVVENNLPRPLILYIEPEGASFTLDKGEEVSVIDTFEQEPVTLKVSIENGDPIISIWPGDGRVRVEKGGIDIFELI